MYYPRILPEGTELLSPSKSMEIEAQAVLTLVQGDRDHVVRSCREGTLAEQLVQELRAAGFVEPGDLAGATDLLARNSAPLSRFVAEALTRPLNVEDLSYLTPDWDAVRNRLGMSALEEWRREMEVQAGWIRAHLLGRAPAVT